MARSTLGEFPEPLMPMNRSPGSREILELLDEDRVVAYVVGVSRQRRQLIGQRHDAETRLPVETRAFYDVAREMRGRGSAAAVAADEDVFVRRRAPL